MDLRAVRGQTESRTQIFTGNRGDFEDFRASGRGGVPDDDMKTRDLHSKELKGKIADRCLSTCARTCCEPPGLLQESLGPFGPEVSPECPRECPRKRGVSEAVSDGVSLGHFGPQAPECPKSVPRVSPSVQETFLTLQGDTLGTLLRVWTFRSPGPEGPRRHPVGHSLGHAPFSGTLSGTLRDTGETPVAGRVRNTHACIRAFRIES